MHVRSLHGHLLFYIYTVVHKCISLMVYYYINVIHIIRLLLLFSVLEWLYSKMQLGRKILVSQYLCSVHGGVLGVPMHLSFGLVSVKGLKGLKFCL